ncbi:hypothetical protein D1007_41587 [Hordeum vulgare]|nr:hypothetical protein D1007_41587 [Hordeum vulgare]
MGQGRLQVATPMATTGGTLAGQRRVCGRFWALAEDEDPDDDPGLQLPEVSSPSPSDLVCESLQLGYTEEEVAQTIDVVVPPSDRPWSRLGELAEDRVEVLRRIVHRRTSASAIRPWKEPIPKVRLPALTLADFIDSWKEVPARKKNIQCPRCGRRRRRRLDWISGSAKDGNHV